MIRFELYRDAAGEHRFRIVASNGETIAASEGYKRKLDALETIALIRAAAAAAELREVETNG